MQKQFQISEEMIRTYSQEILMWGQEKRLEPAELSIVLKLVSDWLSEQLGSLGVTIEKKGRG